VQTTRWKCWFFNSLQFRSWFKCKWFKWIAIPKAWVADDFNTCLNTGWSISLGASPMQRTEASPVTTVGSTQTLP
jgi:hypothetical protein